MKKRGPRSCIMLCCLYCALFSGILSTHRVNAQSEEVEQDKTQIWVKNCALRVKYRNELIFSATQTGNSVSMVAQNRKAYISVFKGLLLDDERAIKSRRDKILKMITKAPGEYTVIISAELDREVDTLWEDIVKKAQSLGIKCKK